MGNTTNRPPRPTFNPIAPPPAVHAPAAMPPLTKARLSYAEYLRLEKQCGIPGLNSSTTGIEAGYAMGVEKVLRLLREGFVIDPQ